MAILCRPAIAYNFEGAQPERLTEYRTSSITKYLASPNLRRGGGASLAERLLRIPAAAAEIGAGKTAPRFCNGKRLGVNHLQNEFLERTPSSEFDLCVLPISVLECRASFEHRVLEDTEDCPGIEADLGLTVPKLRSHLSAADVSTWSLPEAVSVCGREFRVSQSIQPSMRTRKPNHTAQRTRHRGRSNKHGVGRIRQRAEPAVLQGRARPLSSLQAEWTSCDCVNRLAIAGKAFSMRHVPDLIGQIEAAIRRHKLLRAGQRLLVAVSGGLDSMVLLHVLHQIGAHERWVLTVAHLNHRLRGRSSDADERKVRATARQLGIPCVCERVDVRQHAELGGESIEMTARSLRHAFLARAARARDISGIALAHHADDEAELFLLRLLRGAGSEGLGGMKPHSPSPADPRIRIVRPLLEFPKSALARFARDNGIAYREDASNASSAFARNRVRHELIPWLTRHFQPALGRLLVRQAEVLGHESDYLNACTDEWLRCPGATTYDELAIALQRRVLLRQLIALGVAPEFDLIESLRVEPARVLNVRPQLSLWRDAEGRLQTRRAAWVTFQDGAEPVVLAARPRRVEFDGVRFDWALRRHRGAAMGKVQAGSEWYDAERVGERVVLRHWRPGDRFQPIGLPSAVKLQDLFTNAKVPRDERRQRVVATTADDTIWWVEGLRIADGFKLRPGTRMRLNWRWRRGCA
jgi:tRNA(Ile)-lysidine synthase